MSSMSFPVTPPPVIRWFKIYAGFMAFLYAVCSAAGILIAIFRPDDMDAVEAMVVAAILILICAPLFLAFLAAILLRPKPWVWIFDLVLIAIGLTSCLTIPACVPLLIFWLKPETKAYFGRT